MKRPVLGIFIGKSYNWSILNYLYIMKNLFRYLILFILTVILLINTHSVRSQATVGIIQYAPGQQDGYVLFAPNSSDTTYLIDKCGRQIHEWHSIYKPGQSVYLLEDGTLLRTGRVNNPVFAAGGTGGVIEKLDWNSQVLWSYVLSDSLRCSHHDIRPLPNGNILVLSWSLKRRAQAIAAGRDTAFLGTALWSEQVQELQPVGTDSAMVVWEWNVWDHLVQELDATKPNYGSAEQHPELIHLNFVPTAPRVPDWLHCNGLDYNAALDQVIVSCHNFSELWIIDHSTTTSEAASHSGGRYGKGGDLLYRWGNPETYGRGNASDRKWFGQHNPHWIPSGFHDEGKILVFNNGLARPAGAYSTVEIINPPTDSVGNYLLNVNPPFGAGPTFGPDIQEWIYSAPVPSDFYSLNISGAQRLRNGNTLVCSGNDGIFFEIDSAEQIVWKYINPTSVAGAITTQGGTAQQNSSFRCTLIEASYPGLAGQSLIPGDPIELQPLPLPCTSTGISGSAADSKTITVLNPVTDRIRIHGLDHAGSISASLMDYQGRIIQHWSNSSGDNFWEEGLPLNENLVTGLYILKLEIAGETVLWRLVKTD